MGEYVRCNGRSYVRERQECHGRALNLMDAAEAEAWRYPMNTLAHRVADAVRLEALELSRLFDRDTFPAELAGLKSRLMLAECVFSAIRD